MAVSGTIQQHQYAQISDVGCVRKLNEDSVYSCADLWLVADGMGGHACGDVASRIAIDTIAQSFANNNDLSLAIESAHQKVLAQGDRSETQKGMGTTVVALTSREDEFEIAWVGDSRAYLWQPDRKELTLLTTDHSLVAELVRKGMLSNEQAHRHPKRHMITRCLGSRNARDFQVDVCRGTWQSGEQILLCSDGLSDELSDEQMVSLLQQPKSNQSILNNLVCAAKEAGGRDNISAILVDAPRL